LEVGSVGSARFSAAHPRSLWEIGVDGRDFLTVARLLRPRGRKGEVIAEILTDFPERFQDAADVYLETAGHQPRPVRVENAWTHKDRVVLKFSGIDSIEEAGRLRGAHVLIPREERRALGAHTYYLWELKGCRVLRERADASLPLLEVGMVTDVDTESTEISLLIVAASGSNRREILIPLVQSICKHIDIQQKIILVDPPEDLLELNG
jgi:16S rRNA processing protein RimM